MIEPTPLEQRLQKAEGKLNLRRRQLLQSILDQAEDTYYLSSRKLADRFGVDAATLVRSIQVLGYNDYSSFLADLRCHFVTRITQYRVMQSTTRARRTIHEQVRYSLELDRANFETLGESVSAERIVALARRLNKAEHVLVVGVDFAYSLAWLMAYGLSWLGMCVEAPIGGYGNLHHRARSLGSRDILVAMSFGRCLRVSVETARTAREQGAWTFGITDACHSPLASVCHDHWVVSVTNPIHKASYVAPVAALNALQVACAYLAPKRSLKRLREIEREEEAAGRWYAPAAAVGEKNRK